MWKEITVTKVNFPGGNEGLGCLPKFRGDRGPPKDSCWNQSYRPLQQRAGDLPHEKFDAKTASKAAKNLLPVAFSLWTVTVTGEALNISERSYYMPYKKFFLMRLYHYIAITTKQTDPVSSRQTQIRYPLCLEIYPVVGGKWSWTKKWTAYLNLKKHRLFQIGL